MTVLAASVTVGVTATQLSSPTDDNAAGHSLVVKVPAGGATVFVGGPGVTTTAGYPLAAGESFSADLTPGDALFGIVATGTQAVNVLRVGV